MTPTPLILVLDRDLQALHVRAIPVLRGLFGFGLQVEVAGGGSEEAVSAWSQSGIVAHRIPLSGRHDIRERLAGPVLVSRIAANPPALIHVADESLMHIAHLVKATFPSTSIVVEVDGPPRWLERLDGLPDGTSLVESVVPLAERVSLPAKDSALAIVRRASARAVGLLRTLRTASWVNAWLVRTREGERAFEALTAYQAGRVASHEYGWGVDSDALLVEGERDSLQRNARQTLTVGAARGVICAPLVSSDSASNLLLLDVISASLDRIPQIRWLVFGATPDDRAVTDRLNLLMQEGRVEFMPGYANRRDVYLASDILVSCSAEQAHGWLMEMSATRAPVVTIDSPRNRIVLRNGENGFLIDGSDVEAWTDRIRYLVDKPDQRGLMGARARQLAMRLFDSQLMQRRLFRTWDAVLREQFEARDLKEQARTGSENRERDRDLLSK